MLFSSRVSVRFTFSVWLVSGYSHVFVQLAVVIVTLPPSAGPTITNTAFSFIIRYICEQKHQHYSSDDTHALYYKNNWQLSTVEDQQKYAECILCSITKKKDKCDANLYCGSKDFLECQRTHHHKLSIKFTVSKSTEIWEENPHTLCTQKMCRKYTWYTHAHQKNNYSGQRQ